MSHTQHQPHQLLRIGVIADVHLCLTQAPPVSFHHPYALEQTCALYDAALHRCQAEDVDAIVLLGDLTHHGDTATMAYGIRRASALPSPVWVVPGNHDVDQHAEQMAMAVAATQVDRVAIPSAAGFYGHPQIRVAGLTVVGESGGQTVRTAAPTAVPQWGDDTVVWLTHYPMVSTVDHLAAAGLRYAGDLADHADAAAPLLERSHPTIVVHGHLHVRDEHAVGRMLQLSCAALVEPPHELTIVDLVVQDDELQINRRSIAIAPSPAVQLPVLTADRTTWRYCAGGWTLM